MKVRKRRSKSSPARRVELLHLRLRQHAGHEHHVLRAAHRHRHAFGVRLGHRLTAGAEPVGHQDDLVGLGVDDALGQPHDGWTRTVA